MSLDSIITIVVGLAFVIMSFYLADILNRRRLVFKFIGKDYGVIPASEVLIPRWKITLAFMWVVFGIAAFFLEEELIINPYAIFILAILSISTTFLGKGGFDNRGSVSKKFFYGDEGILLTPANQSNPFSSEYLLWDSITKTNFKQDPKYELYYHVKIILSNGNEKELFVIEKDKDELKELFDRKLNN
jgi:hypothetical protein